MRHTQSPFPTQKVSNLQDYVNTFLKPIFKVYDHTKKFIHPDHVVIQANLEKILKVKKKKVNKRKRKYVQEKKNIYIYNLY